MRAGRIALAAAGAVLGDLPAELVTEDDLLVRAHEVLVARLDHHVGELVAVMARVEVRAADAAAKDVDQKLALAGHRRLALDDRELGLVAADRLHDSRHYLGSGRCGLSGSPSV